MDIKFTVTKGYPAIDPGKTVSIVEFAKETIPIQRLAIADFAEMKPDHINLMFDGGYQIYVISESAGPRVTLKLPGG